MMNEEDQDIDEVMGRLSILAPDASEAPQQKAAFARYRREVMPAHQISRSTRIMLTRRFATVSLTLALAIAALVAFPSVRAAASDFLGLFRVQKFAPITITPQQLALLDELEEQGLQPGEFVATQEPGEPQSVDSVEAAEALTGLSLRSMPSYDLPAEIYVTGDAAGYLVVNLAGARAIVEAAGADPMLLPDSLDGARVNVTVYDSVQQVHSDGLRLLQTPSPDVNYPEDVDPVVLGQALLQVLGMDPATAEQMARSIDWTSTLLLPIPQSMGSYRDISVDGVSGVALEPFDPEADPALIWQKNGMIHVLTGPFDVDQLIELTNRLR